MEAAVAEIVGRPLTEEDRRILIALRDRYGYDDNDPLVPVLAMMGAVRVMTQAVPAELRAAAKEITELHMTGLREQSMFVAKDLVTNITGLIYTAGRSRLRRTMEMVASAAVGALATGAAMYFLKF